MSNVKNGRRGKPWAVQRRLLASENLRPQRAESQSLHSFQGVNEAPLTCARVCNTSVALHTRGRVTAALRLDCPPFRDIGVVFGQSHRRRVHESHLGRLHIVEIGVVHTQPLKTYTDKTQRDSTQEVGCACTFVLLTPCIAMMCLFRDVCLCSRDCLSAWLDGGRSS